MSEINPYAPPKASTEGAAAPAVEATPDSVFKPRKKIGGWLILVTIGLVFTIFRVSTYLISTYLPIFTQGAWERLTSPDSPSYHPLWGPLLVFEVIGNIGSVTLALLTLVHMFRYSRRTPKLAISMYAWGVFFVGIDFFASDFIPFLASQNDPEGVKELVRSLVGAAIWVPYFLVSKRVKETFVD